MKPKKIWSCVRQETVLQNAIPALVQDDASLTTNEIEKVKVLSKFFSSVFTHEPPGELKIPDLDITHPIKDLEITEQLVKEQLDSLNTSKSPGPDEIHPKRLFKLRDFLTQVLTKILNKSWDETKLPQDWKLAHIASLFKTGKKSLADNYRPVSLTSIVRKIIRDHLMEHLEKNEILVNEQFGFLPGRSSQLQLLRVLDDFTKTIDS